MGSSFVVVGAAAAAGAVLLFVATIFWRPAAKARRLRSSHHDPSRPPNSDLLRADADVQAIFLSHSGKQKPFVEHLYNTLMNANHTAFFDKHSLPQGSPFPPHIEQAALNCKLGVVVLSEDFLTSKWPMLELEMLVLQRQGPDASVLPLFYKLEPADLKSRNNLAKWRKVWMKMVDRHVADQWGRAVRKVASFNDELFVQGTSEVAYIMKVVKSICTCVPPRAPYDISSVEGQQRLAEEIARRFEDEDGRQYCEEARMVGLHGVGGMGKTTLCKTMVNFYHSHYVGRSMLIEFPTPTPATLGDDKSKIIAQKCKEALKKLTNLIDELVLNKTNSFDEVVGLMREHVKRYDVFLAIDNVWESYRREADRILGVRFTANSKILLTSRSEQLLQDLLRRHNNTSVGSLPAPEHEEAFQIFQKSVNLPDVFNALVKYTHQIDTVLKSCKFNGTYHALALIALGHRVRSGCALVDQEKVEHHLSLILEEISNENLQTVEDVIRLNYENLPQQKKHMFLDIAVLKDVTLLVSQILMKWNIELTYAVAYKWLCFLYKESQVAWLLYELALDGLIQIEVDERAGEKMIRVHDLFQDLAQREAARSSRFFMAAGGWTKSVEGIEWERLERVFLSGGKDLHFIEKLQQQECPKLQVLYAVDITSRSGIHLDFMPSLRVLILKWQYSSAVTSSAAMVEPDLQPIPSVPSMEDLTTKNSRAGVTTVNGLHASRVLNLNCLVRLQMQGVIACSLVQGIAGLDALKNLRMLYIEECPSLNNLNGLSGLILLEALVVLKCASLKTMPDVSDLTCLERLELRGNNCMEEVGCLSSALKDVSVRECRALKKMPDVSGLTCLERLELGGNESMEEVVGCLSSTLKDVSVLECRALKKMPDVSGLTCLERLKLGGNECMEEVGCLSSALKDVSVSWCGALKKMPDVSGLTCLERLQLWGNASMEEVGCLSSALKNVSVGYCRALKKMPDVSGLTCLERLQLGGNESMEEVGCLSSALKDVSVWECPALKKMPDVSGLTFLERLRLEGNESMEEVGGEYFGSTLEDLEIRGCKALRRLPSLNDCVHLKELRASSCHINGLVKDIEWKHFTSLQTLVIMGACVMDSDGEVVEVGTGLTNLTSVEVWSCDGSWVERRGGDEELRISICTHLNPYSY